MFNQYVICNKNAGGTAIIAREEFEHYSRGRRRREFNLVMWLTSPRDEEIAVRKWPRFRRLIESANAMGLGNGCLDLEKLFGFRR